MEWMTMRGLELSMLLDDEANGPVQKSTLI
jgi:hypothetical protein